MSKLHELLAVESDLENVNKKTLDEARTTFGKKASHFHEMHRKLENFNADDQEAPEEHQEMVTTVHDKLEYIQGHVGRYWDAVYMKEKTNQAAAADIVTKLVVNGVAVLANQANGAGADAPEFMVLGQDQEDLQHGEGVVLKDGFIGHFKKAVLGLKATIDRGDFTRLTTV